MDNTKQKKVGRPKCFCREEALGKAMQIFCENGYEATSVAQLGDAMNMKPPSLYNAFGDKEKLFLEVLDYYHKPFEAATKHIFDNAENAQDAIRKLIDLSRSYHTNPDTTGCLVVNSTINVGMASDHITNKIKSLHDKNETMVYERLKQGQEDGDIPADINVRSVTRYINGILQGAAVIARVQQSPQIVSDILDQGYQGFLKLID